MEGKLDELLESFDALKKSQQDNQADMTKKLEKLERDVQAGQDVAAERVVKKLKRDRGQEFRKKGNEHQFVFNDEIKDRIEAASSLVPQVKSASQQDSETLLKAVEELQEGAKALAFRQKLIQLADRSEFGWDAVKEYETDKLAENDDDAKRLEKAEKSAEQKALKRRKTVQYRYGRGRGRRAQGYAAPHNQQVPASSGVQAQVPPGVWQCWK